MVIPGIFLQIIVPRHFYLSLFFRDGKSFSRMDLAILLLVVPTIAMWPIGTIIESKSSPPIDGIEK